MLLKKILLLVFLGAGLVLSGCEKDPLSQKGKIALPEKAEQKNDAPIVPSETGNNSKGAESKPIDDITELGWDNLIPDEWRPDYDLVEKYNNGELGDDDPRIIKLKEQVKKLAELAPVNKKLDGKKIKMPGFVVPVEMDGEKVREFLLVPYHGACVHVPPPPANQTVYVKIAPDAQQKLGYFDTVWVTGIIHVVNTKNEIAESGYTIEASRVEAYE